MYIFKLFLCGCVNSAAIPPIFAALQGCDLAVQIAESRLEKASQAETVSDILSLLESGDNHLDCKQLSGDVSDEWSPYSCRWSFEGQRVLTLLSLIEKDLNDIDDRPLGDVDNIFAILCRRIDSLEDELEFIDNSLRALSIFSTRVLENMFEPLLDEIAAKSNRLNQMDTTTTLLASLSERLLLSNETASGTKAFLRAIPDSSLTPIFNHMEELGSMCHSLSVTIELQRARKELNSLHDKDYPVHGLFLKSDDIDPDVFLDEETQQNKLTLEMLQHDRLTRLVQVEDYIYVISDTMNFRQKSEHRIMQFLGIIGVIRKRFNRIEFDLRQAIRLSQLKSQQERN